MDLSPTDSPPRRRPRNWHSRTEQFRLFWILLPLVFAAAWVERTWWGPTPTAPQAPIDTILSRGPLTRTIEDGVTIEGEAGGGAAPGEPTQPPSGAPPPPAVAVRDAAETLADATDLALVRDDTVFRAADQQAWFSIWKRLQAEEAGSRPSGREVTFAQLFAQPRSFRGRRVRVAGTIRRLQEVAAPANPLGIATYWQAWLEPVGGPAAPIVVYLLELPPGTPTGMRVEIPAVVDGVFFKRWAYQASDAIRLAPLLMATQPQLPPRITSGRGQTPVVGWALVSIGGLLATTWLALRFAATSQAPGRRHPERLDADFRGVTTTDPREALGRLAAIEDGASEREPHR